MNTTVGIAGRVLAADYAILRTENDTMVLVAVLGKATPFAVQQTVDDLWTLMRRGPEALVVTADLTKTDEPVNK